MVCKTYMGNIKETRYQCYARTGLQYNTNNSTILIIMLLSIKYVYPNHSTPSECLV